MATESGAKHEKKKNIFVRIAIWFKNAALELKRTTWPSFSTVMKKLGIVMVVVLFFFVVLFGMDLLLQWGYDGLVSGLESSSALVNLSDMGGLSTLSGL